MNGSERESVMLPVVLRLSRTALAALSAHARWHQRPVECSAAMAVMLKHDRKDRWDLIPEDIRRRMVESGITREMHEASLRGEEVPNWPRSELSIRAERRRLEVERIRALPPTRVGRDDLCVFVGERGELFLGVRLLLTEDQRTRLDAFWRSHPARARTAEALADAAGERLAAEPPPAPTPVPAAGPPPERREPAAPAPTAADDAVFEDLPLVLRLTRRAVDSLCAAAGGERVAVDDVASRAVEVEFNPGPIWRDTVPERVRESLTRRGITPAMYNASVRGEFVPNWPEEERQSTPADDPAWAARVKNLSAPWVHPDDLRVIMVAGEHFLTIRQLLTDRQRAESNAFWMSQPADVLNACAQTLRGATRDLFERFERSGGEGLPPPGDSPGVERPRG